MALTITDLTDYFDNVPSIQDPTNFEAYAGENMTDLANVFASGGDIHTFISETNALAAEAETNAGDAETAKTAAEAAEAGAIASAGATEWLIGTTYDEGANVWGSDHLTYKASQGSNVGHDPVGDGGTWWTSLVGAETGANADITSMTGLDDDGIPLAKVANAASDGANSDITSMTGLSDDGIPLAKVATAAKDGANSDITSMTGLSDDGIPLAKVATAAKDGANSDITSLTGLTSMGALPSQTPVTDSAANFAANFTGANLRGGTFVCNSAGTCQLPEMVAGMNFTIITLGDIEVVVDTNANDGYLMDGTTNAEGKNITNLSTAGDIAVFQYYTADDWLITTNGWTAEA